MAKGGSPGVARVDDDFALSAHVVALPAGRMNFWHAGPPDAPAVLLVHGLGWDAFRLWQHTARHLAGRGFRVLAPDLFGVGGSDPLAAPRPPEQVADDLMHLCARENVAACAVVGFSLGGTVAMALSARRDTPARAAVFCCAPTGATAADAALTEAMLLRAEAMGAAAFAREQAAAIWHPDFAAAHPAAVADFCAWRAAMDQASLAHAFRSLYGTDLTPRLAAIRQPALVLAADADRFLTVAAAAEVAERLPDATLAVVGDCGHMVPIEQPQKFRAALDAFLAMHWPAT